VLLIVVVFNCYFNIFLLKNIIEIEIFISIVDFSRVKFAIVFYLLRFLDLSIISIDIQYFIDN